MVYQWTENFGRDLLQTTEEHWPKVLGADKRASLLQTLGNNNSDAMFDCKSGFRQSEDNIIYIIIVMSYLFDLYNFFVFAYDKHI